MPLFINICLAMRRKTAFFTSYCGLSSISTILREPRMFPPAFHSEIPYGYAPVCPAQSRPAYLGPALSVSRANYLDLA